MLSKITNFYSLHKARRVLRQSYKTYRRKESSLDLERKKRLQALLLTLQKEITAKAATESHSTAKSLEQAIKESIPKSSLDRFREVISAVLFALIAALVIRQSWFELYTIPSGSMRPTLKEGDLLLVSKTAYGINTLTPTSHVYFNSDLLDRGSITIFSGKNMDIYDVDTLYFYFIPGKKQFVKRLVGKPGDSLYFYGGKIYGVDAKGRDLKELRDAAWIPDDLEHIPFIRFEGKVETPDSFTHRFSASIFSQMNQTIAKIEQSPSGRSFFGELLYSPTIAHYYDHWGLKNFAMARILTPTQANLLYPNVFRHLTKAPLYLEFTHHPSLERAYLERDEYGRARPSLHFSHSLLELSQEKTDLLLNHLTTCRFQIKNGELSRQGSYYASSNSKPHLPGIPNGTYEFQNGKAYQIYFSGIAKELPKEHPLYDKKPERTALFFNLGIEMDTRYNPSLQYKSLAPSRYAYFALNTLYLMGQPIYHPNDPDLVRFVKREQEKKLYSPEESPFLDEQSPLQADGTLDIEFIRQYGITVPQGQYLVLGDNHAMSGDSRQFGFVPQDNLRGKASFLLWPPGPRWGLLPQPSSSFFTLPNLIAWTLFASLGLGSALYLKRKTSKPLSFHHTNRK